jgi:hypothetical protein
MFEAQVAYVGDFTHLSGDVIPLAKAKESILPAMLYQHVRVLLADLLSKAQFPSRMPYVCRLQTSLSRQRHVTDLKSTVALHGAILDVQQRAIARLLAHLRHRDPTIVQAVLSQMQGDLGAPQAAPAGSGPHARPRGALALRRHTAGALNSRAWLYSSGAARGKSRSRKLRLTRSSHSKIASWMASRAVIDSPTMMFCAAALACAISRSTPVAP